MPLNLMLMSHKNRCEGFGRPGHEDTLCGNRHICARHMTLATDPFDRVFPKQDRVCKKASLEAFIPIPGAWR